MDDVSESKKTVEINEIDDAAKEEIYQKAVVAMRGIKNPELQKRAIDLFRTIPGFRDADEKITVCEQRIIDLRAKEEAERIAAEEAAKKRKKTTVIVLSILAFLAAAGILMPFVILPAARYGKAEALYKAGRYEEAITAFEAMKGRRDSETRILDCRYGIAENLFRTGDFEAAAEAFADLGDYKDSAARIASCHEAALERDYEAAMALVRAGNAREAYPLLTALKDYKDSAEQAAAVYEAYKEAVLKDPGVGDHVFFGACEQDNDLSNGKEDIEWVVLAVEDGRALLVSRYALDYMRYNDNQFAVSWGTCSLRRWLNKEFLGAAFTEAEQARIWDTPFTEGKGTSLIEGGTDKVFIFSQAEVYDYFDSDEARKCAATDYAIARGARTSSTATLDGKPTCWWWLRMFIATNYNAAGINIDGAVYHQDMDLWLAYDAVRPALWIQVDS